MAAHAQTPERRTEKLDFRVSRGAKERLQAAARIAHRSMSDFVMESALAKADETLAKRRLFSLSEEDWAAFQQALDAPPQSLPRLKTLLSEPGFFDAGS